MSDTSIAVDDGVETEAVETEETETEVVAAEEAVDTEEEAEAQETEVEEEPEIIEFDFGGNKFQVEKGSIPDELAEQVQGYGKSIEADYIRKTQALAEQTKAVEADKAVVEKLSGLQGEAFDLFSKGLQIKAEIEQLGQYDLNEMWQSNPDQARRISDMIASKQAELTQHSAQVASKEQEFQQAQQQDTVRRMEEGRAKVEAAIRDFPAEAVKDYVVSTYGVPQTDADQWPLNPAAAQMAYKAMKYDEMQAKAKKPKPVAQKAKPVKPVAKTGGATVSATPSDKDDVDTWLKKRRQQLQEA